MRLNVQTNSRLMARSIQRTSSRNGQRPPRAWAQGKSWSQGSFVVIEDFESQEHSTTARLSLTRVQFVECALQLFKLLSSLAELAFRRQALVVGKVFGGFRDERAEIRWGLGRRGGSPCASLRFRGDCRCAHRRDRSTKKRRHCRLEGWSIRKPILQSEHDQAQLRHRTPLGLQVNWLRIQQRASGRNHQ